MRQLVSVNEPDMTITVLTLYNLRLNAVFTIWDGYEQRGFSEVNLLLNRANNL